VYETNSGDFVGAAAIKLINLSSPDVGYSLVINNGTQTFKYNENGISPASNAIEVDKRITIPESSFTIYDKNGNAIDA
jgi:hypothetical protein